jgi:predicted choloylglycine hydrolase
MEYMYNRSYRIYQVIAVAIMVTVFASLSFAEPEALYREKVVAGGVDKFMEVRHVFIKGSNYEIGRRIGEIAAKCGKQPLSRGGALLNRIQREYVAHHYPILYERMRGIAAAFGLEIEDDRYDFSSIMMFPMRPPGCSGVFYPGSCTENGHGVLSRNYDFTTGTMQGQRPKGDQVPVMSRPYIFELYPEKGYSSIALCAFDMVGGVLDGINEKGLVVAIFGDDDTAMRHGLHPSNSVGLHELMSMRYLLDTCSNVAEAKEALLLSKHIYAFVPCHYLIADRSGESFVFEFSPYRQSTFIVDGEGPQCVTNHLVYKYSKIEEFPDSVMIDTFDRYRILHQAVTERKTFTIDEITAINAEVSNTGMAFDHPDYAPGRTLWHSLYDTSDLSLRVKFYLGDKPGSGEGEGKIAEYSDYINLKLRSR